LRAGRVGDLFDARPAGAPVQAGPAADGRRGGRAADPHRRGDRPGPDGRGCEAAAVSAALTAFARAALPAYGLPPDAPLTLLNVSENATFAVDDPAGGRSVLRVHRTG